MAKVSLCNTWVLEFSSAKNEELMLKQFDSLEESQEAATIRLVDYQQKLARRYNRDMRIREFWVGDLVLRKAVGSVWDINARKLALNWEGPYRVTVIAGVGAYYLEDIKERPLPQLWNVWKLRKFYH